MMTARLVPLPSVCDQLSVELAADVAAWLTPSVVMIEFAKVAVMFFVVSTVTLVTEFVDETSPVYPTKCAPEFGVAVNCTCVPCA